MARSKEACLASLAELERQLADAREGLAQLRDAKDELFDRYRNRVERVGLREANTDEVEIVFQTCGAYKTVIKCIGQLIDWNIEELRRSDG